MFRGIMSCGPLNAAKCICYSDFFVKLSLKELARI